MERHLQEPAAATSSSSSSSYQQQLPAAARAARATLRLAAAAADARARTQVAVGCDPRVSGPLLVPSVLSGIQSEGAAAVDVGLSTTPAMFYGIIAPGGSSSSSKSCL